MKKNLRNLLYIFALILSAIMFCACKHSQSIDIRHDSPEITKNIMQNSGSKAVVKKSSGIIIYKDNSTTNTTSGGNIHFGPSDLNFDVQIKMR